MSRVAPRLRQTLTRWLGRQDVSTVEGRGLERRRRVLLTAIASAAARGSTILATLLVVPLALDHLGPERYGVWLTLSSLLAMAAFADLGMGNGLLNAIAECHGKRDHEMARVYTTSTIAALSAVAGAILLITLAAWQAVPWPDLLNVADPLARSETPPALLALIAILALGLPLGVVQRVQLGYQEGFVNSLWVGFGNLLGVIAVVVALWLDAGLPWLVVALAGSPLLATAANGVVLFAKRRPELRPRLSAFSAPAARRILRLGLMFLILQATVAVAFTSDNLVAARVLGQAAVTEYGVTARLFAIVSMLLGLFLQPLWPAYGEAFARGDVAWIKRALRRSCLLALAISAGLSSILVAFGRPILHVWVGPTVTPSFWLLLGLGTWTVLYTTGTALSMFLNGINVIGFQVLSAVVMSVAALSLKVVLAHEVGLAGIAFGTVIAYTLLTVVPFLFYLPRLLARLSAVQEGP